MAATNRHPETLAQKVWERHVVHAAPDEPDLLYIDLHLVHEVTSPQAFEGLRLAGRKVRRPELTIATADHNVPDRPTRPADRRPDLEAADRHAARERREFGIIYFTMGDPGRASSTSSAPSWASRSRA